jgi:hypothetical protein
MKFPVFETGGFSGKARYLLSPAKEGINIREFKKQKSIDISR